MLTGCLQESFLNEWPEEPYYDFLLETGSVLRDDQGLVAEVKALTPPETLRYVGWNRARAFLFLALNKKILHRAFEVSAVYCSPCVLDYECKRWCFVVGCA